MRVAADTVVWAAGDAPGTLDEARGWVRAHGLTGDVVRIVRSPARAGYVDVIKIIARCDFVLAGA